MKISNNLIRSKERFKIEEITVEIKVFSLNFSRCRNHEVLWDDSKVWTFLPSTQQLYCFFLHRFIQKYSQAVYLVTFLDSKLSIIKESVFRGLKLHVWSLLLINISIPKTSWYTNTYSHPFQSIQYREPVKQNSKCFFEQITVNNFL